MTSKRVFVVLLRIIFVLFSLQFLKDAFFKWDGYSYYMRFTEFLPDLSLAYILWTSTGVILVFLIWLIIYGIIKINFKFLRTDHIEQIMAWFIGFLVIKMGLAFIVERSFLKLNYVSILEICGVIVTIVVWFMRKYAGKILNGFNNRITPLVWLFAVLFIIAIPLTVFKKDFTDSRKITEAEGYASHSKIERPNIILVVMDTLTSVDMQLYGYDRPTTPFITGWAKEATVFNKAYASSNWTAASTMSLMTGQRVWTHGIWYQAFNHPVIKYENNLPQLLEDYGYDVYAFVQNPVAHPDILGIKDAFSVNNKAHTFWISSGWWFDKIEELLIDRPIVQKWLFDTEFIVKTVKKSFRPSMFKTLNPPEKVFNNMLMTISQSISNYPYPEIEAERPFFAWLHLYPPHNPYLPPEPYMGIFGDDQKFNTDKKQDESGVMYENYPPGMQADVDILRKRYDEFILYCDQQFKQFLLRLAETIDMSNTIIILSSDHGESFSHGYQGHGGSHLYEPLVHIPLIIKWYGQANGREIDIPVDQVDVAPTILEFAGIPIPDWMEGISLVPLIKGRNLNPLPVFSMQLINNQRMTEGGQITKGTIAVWDGDYKLIYYIDDDKKLLFNLNIDPNENNNLYKEEAEIGGKLLRLINTGLSKANKRIIESRVGDAGLN